MCLQIRTEINHKKHKREHKKHKMSFVLFVFSFVLFVVNLSFREYRDYTRSAAAATPHS
jgi:hypothetical protein